MSGDLAAFLSARLDEDEAAGGEQWEFHPGCRYEEWTSAVRAPAEPLRPGGAPYRVVANCDDDGAHIARHDPARVLREVGAKRAILAEYTAVRKLHETTGGKMDGYRDWVLRHLAAVYRDHPGYQPEWAPVSPAARR